MKTSHRLLTVLLLMVLLAGCSSGARVGKLQTESQSVELGDAKAVNVMINMGAGDLELTGGADNLLETQFTYNVANLKPEVRYKDGMLTLKQPSTSGFPVLQGITGFRNEWNLRFSNQAPMDLSVALGAGTSDLKLAGLSLTGLDVNLGAGECTIDLGGDWARSLDVTIQTGAANTTLRLPNDVGVLVKVERGPSLISTSGLNHHENVYTNAAYGVAGVTMKVEIDAGIGMINLELVDR